MSGAKISWEATKKITLQVNAFNSFNSFTENNRKKAIGFSGVIDNGKGFSTTLNVLATDDSPAGALPQGRLYFNWILFWKPKRFILGAEANYGIQEHSMLSDSTQSAYMVSALGAVSYRIFPHLSVFGRYEFFYDPNEILTGPVQNEFHQLVGLNLWGATAGLEYRIIKQSYLRLETRRLQTKADENIFFYNGRSTNIRWEFSSALGIWF